MHKRNELRELVLSIVNEQQTIDDGITSKEVANLLNRDSTHICQILKALVVTGEISCRTVKRSVERAVRLFFNLNAAQLENHIRDNPCCGSCQWLSAIQRCTLLDLVTEINPSLLPPELRPRALKPEIPRDLPACPYFTLRVPGQLKSKPFSKYIKENFIAGAFHCPTDRCCQIIDGFSDCLQMIKIGSSAYYCPHCGSPMFFGYNERFDDYRILYWDSKYDLLQRSFHDLTGMVLPQRNKSQQGYGVSILKEGSFTLDRNREVLYVGSKTTPERLIHSNDLTFFPLRTLNYIYTQFWDDYYYLEEKLHALDPGTNKKLYGKIKLYPPIDRIESTEPLEMEIGGNELLIASEVLNVPSFQANIQAQIALVEIKIDSFVDADLKPQFITALQDMKKVRKHYGHLKHLDSNTWQRYEGGIRSLMVTPFKLEAQKYGFLTPARPKSRMVRYDHFLPYGLFYALSVYDCLINGVNYIITAILKREIYNSIPFAWDGLRGWCHKDYPIGLYLDTIEQAKIIALLWIHEAIRNKEIQPKDFIVNRGKRFEPYYCVKPDSDLHKKIIQIAMQALRTSLTLASEQTMKMKEMYHRFITQQKELVNRLSMASAVLTTTLSTNGHIQTLWKKLLQTKNKDLLTHKEQQQLQHFCQRFLSDDYQFEPLAIASVE